jgi:DNA-binding IclR family transcriptional regulator
MKQPAPIAIEPVGPPQPPGQINNSLVDGLRCLQAVCMSPAPVGSRLLSQRLEIEHTRANRLLKTLAHLGLLRQDTDRRYTAGSGMHVLVAQSLFGSGYFRAALEPLDRLHKRFKHTVALGLLWRTDVCYLYHSPRGTTGADLGRIGLRPALQSGIGMILLATMRDEDVRKLYVGPDTPQLPGGVDDLLKKLHRFRRQGYSQTPARSAQGQTSFGVAVPPLFDSAVAMSGCITAEQKCDVVQALRDTVQMIAERREGAAQTSRSGSSLAGAGGP